MKNSRRDTTSINELVALVFDKMSNAGVDAVVFSNKAPVIYSGCEDRYRALDYLFGSSDDNSVCLFLQGRVFFISDSRYSIELNERFRDVDKVTVSIISGDPEDSAYLSILNRIKESGKKITLAVEESVVHSPFYMAYVRNEENIILKHIDLINWVWKDRPEQKSFSINNIEDVVFPNTYRKIFTPRSTKLSSLIMQFNNENPNSYILFSNPSDIAWLLNIRSFDNPPSLLPPSILIISNSTGYLFVQGNADNKLKYIFSNLNVNDDEVCLVKDIHIFSLDDFFTKSKYLIPVSSTLYTADLSYPAYLLRIFDPEKYTYKIFDRVGFDYMRTTHTVEECESIKKAFEFDSLVFLKFFIKAKSEKKYFKNEMDVVKFLDNERNKNKYYISNSFITISAFGPNGAICHYEPSIDRNREIDNGLLVLDFGSQYDFGTTDSTRTILFGKASKEEIRHYSAVLKSHIYLQRIDFKDKTDGYCLDFLARSLLNEYSIEVPHGIGHGVEMIGNVHDIVPRLSSKPKTSLFRINPGMIFTIEPGSYVEGKFGVRIENTCLSVRSRQGYMKFEPLTMMPYDIDLIDKSMLSESDIDFINNYHEKIYEKFEGMLDDDEKKILRKIIKKI